MSPSLRMKHKGLLKLCELKDLVVVRSAPVVVPGGKTQFEATAEHLDGNTRLVWRCDDLPEDGRPEAWVHAVSVFASASTQDVAINRRNASLMSTLLAAALPDWKGRQKWLGEQTRLLRTRDRLVHREGGVLITLDRWTRGRIKFSLSEIGTGAVPGGNGRVSVPAPAGAGLTENPPVQ